MATIDSISQYDLVAIFSHILIFLHIYIDMCDMMSLTFINISFWSGLMKHDIILSIGSFSGGCTIHGRQGKKIKVNKTSLFKLGMMENTLGDDHVK